MNTIITIMRPGQEAEQREVVLPDNPGFHRLDALLRPLLDGKHLDGLPRNEAATPIYRNNWLRQHPKDEPESLPAIYGPAVLFNRRVWF